MKFAYTALSVENKKLTGILEALSLTDAQDELHKMGLSIISVSPISEAEYLRKAEEEKKQKAAEGIITFSFKGIDTQGKLIEGTIDAPSPFEAYKRLVTEFQFKIQELEKNDINALKERLEKEPTAVTAKTDEEELAEVEYETNTEIMAQIDGVIKNTKDILLKNKDFFSFDQISKIEGTLSELERVRTSNNLKHIAEISNHLYELIRLPQKASKQQMEKTPQFLEMLSSLKENTLVKKEISTYKKRILFKEVQIIFQKLFRKLKTIASKEVIAPEEQEVKEEIPEEPAEKQGLRAILKSALTEVDSFIAWLLGFYLMYFFLADLSLEKGIGLPADFVFSTLRSNLLLSLTFFLLLTNFLFFIRAGLFLSLAGFAAYGFILFNF